MWFLQATTCSSAVTLLPAAIKWSFIQTETCENALQEKPYLLILSLSLSIQLDWYYCQLFSDLVVILWSILTFLQFAQFFSCHQQNFKGLIVWGQWQCTVHTRAIVHKNTFNSRNTGSYVNCFLLFMKRSALNFIFFEKFHKLLSHSEYEGRQRQSKAFSELRSLSLR